MKLFIFMADFYGQRRPQGAPLEATGGPLEGTEASSRPQIWAQGAESRPLTTPPGPLKLQLFSEEGYTCL